MKSLSRRLAKNSLWITLLRLHTDSTLTPHSSFDSTQLRSTQVHTQAHTLLNSTPHTSPHSNPYSAQLTLNSTTLLRLLRLLTPLDYSNSTLKSTLLSTQLHTPVHTPIHTPLARCSMPLLLYMLGGKSQKYRQVRVSVTVAWPWLKRLRHLAIDFQDAADHPNCLD